MSAAPVRLEIDPALWREVFLVQDDVDNGGVLSMALLRPLAWLNEHKVEVGAWVPIDLPEMGVQGEALVTAVQPCPDIEEGEGCLVTGTFRRSKALVMELKVAGESEVLGVAGNHLVWSEDRQDWVAVKDLDIVPRKLAELLGRLKGALLVQLQKLWGGYWGRAEWTAGNEKHKIWVDFRSGKVSMASTKQEPSAYVKDLRRRAAKNEKAATAAGKAADALALAEKAAGEIQSATARAANKGASESERASAVKAARSASAKAQESLREFAKDAGEAEKALGSCPKASKRVGEQGLLVHNASVPCDSLDQTKPVLKQRMRVSTISVTIIPVGTPTTPRNESVVRQTVAWVRFGPNKGQYAQPDAQNWVQNVVGRPRLVFRSVDDTGHVIARELGGHGDLSQPLNIVPLHPFVNTGSYKQAEKVAIDAVKQGSCVCVRVTFNYDRTSSYPGRPTRFTYEVWVDGKKVEDVSDRNILSLPGI